MKLFMCYNKRFASAYLLLIHSTKRQGEITSSFRHRAERNMCLSPPLPKGGSRKEREVNATGGSESQFFSISLAPLPLFQLAIPV